jgi:hypothetical protein
MTQAELWEMHINTAASAFLTQCDYLWPSMAADGRSAELFHREALPDWTRTGGELIGSVFFYVDHTAPVDAIRNKLTEIASQSKLWNGKVVSLQVSDCKETTIELRALVSANSASAVWDLRCEVREKLVDFLQR